MYGELISSVTVGAGGASSIDFTSIPQTYTDLVVVWSTRDNASGVQNNLFVTFNGSSSGYSEKILYGNGSGSASLSNSGAYFNFVYSVSSTATSNTFSNGQIYIPNYAGSANKSVSLDVVNENNATAALQVLNAGLWSNTAAITSIKLTSNGATIQQYSTAYLYGLTKGSGGATVS